MEQTLHDAYLAAAAALEGVEEPAQALGAELQKLMAPINDYFDNVMVNDEDPTVRSARLALVQAIAALPGEIGDLSRLQGF